MEAEFKVYTLQKSEDRYGEKIDGPRVVVRNEKDVFRMPCFRGNMNWRVVRKISELWK